MDISIISASVREGRKSHRVALFFQKFMAEHYHASATIHDLNELNFPLFNERLRFQKNPLPRVKAFASQIHESDGVVIVTPEYNGGYPASLKNVIDLLYDEWHHKPIAIVTVSDGVFGGMQVITSLQFVLWKIRALTVPALFPVPSVLEQFSEDGTPLNPESIKRRAMKFCDELLWCINAVKKMKS
ncbi:MAG: NAD(P)H-dependent oxidoreductase [Bacteroidetes bacterium]|jgi:NAD(P)H-dependent FMN reductase|nr:NAD(P)H-dependent oxidoreductase [Bacteroidota bacterium]